MDEVGSSIFLNSIFILGLIKTKSLFNLEQKRISFFTNVNVLQNSSPTNFLCFLTLFCAFHRVSFFF